MSLYSDAMQSLMMEDMGAKAQTDSAKFIASSISRYDAGNMQGKTRPFDYAIAIGQYRGWVYAAARLNAVAVAQTPLRMYVRKRKGTKLADSRKVDVGRKRFLRGDAKQKPSSYVMGKASQWADEFEEVTEQTQILKLLQRPNPYMGGTEFAQMRMMFLQLTGNFYMHPIVESARIKENTHNRVKELWVVPAQYVKIVPGKGDEWIQEYIYGVNSIAERHFPPDEIKHLKLPNPANQFYGLGVVEAGWPVLKLSLSQREEDQARKDNQSRPDLAVITESANVTPLQLNELQNNWANTFRGTFRSGSPVFLTGKTQVIPLNWAPTEIGDREITVEEIAAVCGVPVSMLKANDPNLASATVGFASWRENTTLPYCRQDEEFLNNALLPIYSIEDDAFLAYDNPVPENREEIRADVVAYVGAGVMTRNEGRQRLGEEQVDEENANKLLVPAGLQPIDRVGEMPAMGPLSFTMGGSNAGKSMRGEPDGNAVVNAGKAGPRAHAGGLAAIKQSEYTYARHQHKADDTARDGEKEKLIREMTEKLNAVFAKQRRRVESALRGDDLTQLDGKAWGSILLKGEAPIMAEINSILAQLHQYNPDIAEAISPYINAQLAQGGVMGLAEINLPADTFSVTNPRVAEFLDSYSVRLAGKINDYSIERLSATLADGVSQGESASALAQRVGEVYDDFSGYRSEMIARTESARAYVAGSERAWAESGIVEKKKWLLASAGCPACLAVSQLFPDGVPLDTPFAPLGSEFQTSTGIFKVNYTTIMGPPLHPACRCSLTAVVKED